MSNCRPFSGNKSGGNRLSAVERQLRALELRKAGWTHERIAAQLGYASASGAHKAVMSALKRVLQEPSDEVRTLELERLDAWLLALEPGIQAGKSRSIEIALRISDRRSALLGLDAPKRVDVALHDLAARVAADEGLDPAAVLAAAESILRGE